MGQALGKPGKLILEAFVPLVSPGENNIVRAGKNKHQEGKSLPGRLPFITSLLSVDEFGY